MLRPAVRNRIRRTLGVVETELDAQVTRPGFEPGLRESKSLVLPLHYRAIRAAFRLRQYFTDSLAD